MDLRDGTRVTPNVALVELLGKGGMGSVWVAEHEGLKTRVAVKFIAAHLVREDPTLLERFNREAALTAQIKSRNVVQTFDHGVMDDGRPYIVMELLEGEPLSALMKREGPLGLDTTEAVVRQTGRALARAHKLGIVHRDIKPDNLFLEADEDETPFLLKVLDFGIAKQTNLAAPSNVTSTNMMVGTPEYMSPEQVLSSKAVDGQADCWSLAVVAYRCLTGGMPFTGETVGAVAVAIAGGVFTPPSHYRPDLPPTVDQWFARALAVDPRGRFTDARAMARAFADAVRGAFLAPSRAAAANPGVGAPAASAAPHPESTVPPARRASLPSHPPPPSAFGGGPAPTRVEGRTPAGVASLPPSSAPVAPPLAPPLGPPAGVPPAVTPAAVTTAVSAEAAGPSPSRRRRTSLAILAMLVTATVAGMALMWRASAPREDAVAGPDPVNDATVRADAGATDAVGAPPASTQLPTPGADGADGASGDVRTAADDTTTPDATQGGDDDEATPAAPRPSLPAPTPPAASPRPSPPAPGPPPAPPPPPSSKTKDRGF
ncbi:MAG: protein kinase [Myxococcota bacterium]